jgi:phosphocarrier protein
MVSGKVVVTNPSGFHLRPAGLLSKTAVCYKSSIVFKYRENNSANAKSVLSVLGACIRSGEEVEFFCEGPDEEEALEAMINIIKSGLGEV